MSITFISTNPEDLLSEFQQMVSQTQQSMMGELTVAQGSGNLNEMQEISIRMQKSTQEIGFAYQDYLMQITQGGPASLYNAELCDFDLDLTVYHGDRDYILEFQRDPDITRCKKDIEKLGGTFQYPRKLLKSSMVLTERHVPELYKIGQRCAKILGLKPSIEFYSYEDSQFKASCYAPDGWQLYILLSSSLLEQFTEDELAFVIGHEIGHALFKHFDYSASQMMNHGKQYLSPLHAMKLFAWERDADISADRIGLICCGDYQVATKTFFKLTKGASFSEEFKLNKYIEQFMELENILRDFPVDPEDWYKTHPFGPLRIMALNLFSQSETYHTLRGGKGGEISAEQLKDKIKNVLSLMEPSYLDSHSEQGSLIQRFIFLSGYLISLADGNVDEMEMQALGSLTDPEIFGRCIKEVQETDMDSLKERLAEMSGDVRNLLSPIQRLNVLRDLAIISFADNSLDQEEVKILHGLCHLLNINDDFIDRVLGELQEYIV
jgi:uncharacterized tellurite resistance protein B-like protein